MNTKYSYIKQPNLSITAADGTVYAYRELGEKKGIPVIFFTHLSANLDNWDPRVVDGVAEKHWVIAFDNTGIGLSSGTVPDSIEQMARDALTFVHTLGFEQIDILALSMGGMVAQELLTIEPKLVRKLILTGTGPRGGEGIKNVTKITNFDMVRAIFTLKDIKTYLFFTRTDNGKQKSKEFLARIKERKEARDKMISIKGYRTQLKAIHKWGLAKPADLSKIKQPTLVVNGDNDRMVPTLNSYDLAKRIPDSELVIYKDSGHVGIFQNHDEFVKAVLEFLTK
ncbi:alpha/beta fold hydrolase [Clostridium estertheticum]|uniref:alpha/beta fold hydrolase n=1 Tax=Clostridium estertheticum TaxID=238834 RepID=UPI001C7D378C|nr:alpha/beta hydrolase [Clostridium estertheticum]MBX4263587.1 alpha/beta hydrolase [Clostridium estertheticum]WLC87413.1 alpha/beta hydrolase [Clostridium estertheticum]